MFVVVVKTADTPPAFEVHREGCRDADRAEDHGLNVYGPYAFEDLADEFECDPHEPPMRIMPCWNAS